MSDPKGQSGDDLDRSVARRTETNPDYPGLVQDALNRRALEGLTEENADEFEKNVTPEVAEALRQWDENRLVTKDEFSEEQIVEIVRAHRTKDRARQQELSSSVRESVPDENSPTAGSITAGSELPGWQDTLDALYLQDQKWKRLWMQTPMRALGGRTPAQALRDGDVQLTIEVARAATAD